MINLYNKNGLIHWTQKEIRIREMLRDYFVSEITEALYGLNKAWTFYQCDAPILMRSDDISTDHDVYIAHQWNAAIERELRLRPETTKGSYAYADYLQANPQSVKLPLCVYQYGKSFRREQDQPTKFMRLKEFYQLEFQCIYSEGTKCDYRRHMRTEVFCIFKRILGLNVTRCLPERLPNYSSHTEDILYKNNKELMELCSISQRTDYSQPVLEIAIGIDRCVYKFLE